MNSNKYFKEIHDDEVITFVEAENKYRNANYLMINTEFKNGTIYGTVCAISTDPSTLGMLVKLEEEFQAKNISTLMGGEYSNSTIDDLEIVKATRL